MRPLILALALIVPAHGATRWEKAWRWSVAALAAGNSADIASSWGHAESNAIIRGAGGRFAPRRGIAIKASVTGGMALLQWRLAKRYPTAWKPFAVANLAAAGATVGVAGRNWAVTR